MYTPREIRDFGFERVSRGYSPEDVDVFLGRLADQLEQLTAEKGAADQKLMILAEKVEQYRKEEDALRSALISAEMMKESILAEATQQKEIMLNDAQQKAERIVADAEGKIDKEETTLKSLKQQVAAFKAEILNIYKAHLEILSDLPDEYMETEYDQPQQPSAADVFAQTEAQVQQGYAMPAEPQMSDPFAQVAPVQPQISQGYEQQMQQTNDHGYDGFAPRMDQAQQPSQEESVFAAFAGEDTTTSANADSRFGKLDFGENFSFGRD